MHLQDLLVLPPSRFPRPLLTSVLSPLVDRIHYWEEAAYTALLRDLLSLESAKFQPGCILHIWPYSESGIPRMFLLYLPLFIMSVHTPRYVTQIYPTLISLIQIRGRSGVSSFNGA